MSRLWLSARTLFIIAALFTLWQGWVFFRPKPREYSPAEMKAVRAACERAADVLSTRLAARPNQAASAEPPVLGIMHFLDDPNDAFTKTVRDVFSAKSDWRVEEQSVILKFFADIGSTLKSATTLDEIVHAGRRVGLDYVVAGKVNSVRYVRNKGETEFSMYVYDVKQGKLLVDETITETWSPSLVVRLANGLRSVHPIVRLLIWIVFVALLPVVTGFATTWALDRKSNAASFAVLSVYTALDLLTAMLLSGFALTGPVRGILLLVVLLLCAAYNFRACERVAAKAG